MTGKFSKGDLHFLAHLIGIGKSLNLATESTRGYLEKISDDSYTACPLSFALLGRFGSIEASLDALKANSPSLVEKTTGIAILIGIPDGLAKEIVRMNTVLGLNADEIMSQLMTASH